MTVARTAVTITAICLLSGCGPQTGGPSALRAPAGAPPAASGPDQFINASDLPRPRAGLWRNTTDDGDGKPSTDTTCYSGKPLAMKMPTHCSQFTIKRKFLGGIVMDMTCASPRITMVSHSEVNGDFQTKMASDMTMTMTMAGQPPRTTKIHNEATYVGACPAGQKPDDQPDASAAG